MRNAIYEAEGFRWMRVRFLAILRRQKKENLELIVKLRAHIAVLEDYIDEE